MPTTIIVRFQLDIAHEQFGNHYPSKASSMKANESSADIPRTPQCDEFYLPITA
jgi:hypothetical protein